MRIIIRAQVESRERTRLSLEREIDHRDADAVEEVLEAIASAVRTLQRQPEEFRRASTRPRPITATGELAEVAP